MSRAQPSTKILSVQYLRGLAALAVVLRHYGSHIENHPLLKSAFSFGLNGVYLFFLISGFIIVYSLVKSSYRPKQFLTFLLKRSLRIDPPYYAVILLTFLLFRILTHVPSFKGTMPFIPMQFIAHLFYFIPITKYKFYLQVLWSLSVEFQFYLLIGLLYFLTESRVYKTVFLAAFSLSCLLPWPHAFCIVFTYAPIFATGILLVTLYQNRRWYNFIFPGLTLLLTGYQFGIPVALLLLAGSLIILYYDGIIKPLDFIGSISYSLYLTHPLVFIVLSGLLKKLPINRTQYFPEILLAEVIIAILFAWLFYLVIEKPSLKFSKRFFYNRKEKQMASRQM